MGSQTLRWSKRDSNPWSLPARAPPLFADEKGRRSIRMVVNGTRFVGDQRFESRLLQQGV
jgi:hypothetical protein